MNDILVQRLRRIVRELREIALKLWAERRKIVIVNGVVLVAAVLILLFVIPPKYESTVTILPEYGSTRLMGQLSQLASLAGIGEAAPTEIYQNLVYSDAVIEQVVNRTYQTEEYSQPVDLITYLGIESDEGLPADQQDRAKFLSVYKILTRKMIRTNLDRNTRILTVTVTAKESRLSSQLANSIALALDSYVQTQRNSFATSQRQYLENRVAEIQDSLVVAEEALRVFQETNVAVSQSRALQLEQARLTRRISIVQEMFLEVVRQLELARLEEVRDTSVLNIRELTSDPVYKSGPRRKLILIATMYFSLLFSLVYFAYADKMAAYWKIISSTDEETGR